MNFTIWSLLVLNIISFTPGLTFLEDYKDLRTRCIHNTTINIYLPFSDVNFISKSVLINSKYFKSQCVINFNTILAADDIVLLIFEFYMYRKKCFSDEILLNADSKIIHVCDLITTPRDQDKENSLHYVAAIQSIKFDVILNLQTLFDEIKITAVPTVQINKCNKNNIQCKLDQYGDICISKSIHCDDIIKCRMPGNYDSAYCAGLPESIFWVLLATLLMLTLTLFFIFKCIKRNISKSSSDNYFAVPPRNKFSTYIIEPEQDAKPTSMDKHSSIVMFPIKSSISPRNMESLINMVSQTRSDLLKMITDSKNADLRNPYNSTFSEEVKSKLLASKQMGKPIKITYYDDTTTKL